MKCSKSHLFTALDSICLPHVNVNSKRVKTAFFINHEIFYCTDMELFIDLLNRWWSLGVYPVLVSITKLLTFMSISLYRHTLSFLLGNCSGIEFSHIIKLFKSIIKCPFVFQSSSTFCIPISNE